MSAPATIRLSVVIVIHDSRAAVAAALPALCRQLGTSDELVVVDNASTDDTLALVREIAPGAVVVRNQVNEGFAAGANAGARAAGGDLLVFLNPDAAAAPGFAEAIRRPLADGRGWTAWMGLVTADGGRVVNTNGGVVHFTGIAWAGEAGAVAPGSLRGPREAAFVSGACLAVPRVEWERSGGFAEHYFMYQEDVDLSFRLRLAGGRLGVEPGAVVDHDYAFAKGPAKWRRLERNRWATIVRCYPGPLLVAGRAGAAGDRGRAARVAAAGGWLPQKLAGGGGDAARASAPAARAPRGPGTRAISAAEFAAWLTPELDSPFLGRAARSPLLGWGLRAYWRLVLVLVVVRRRLARGRARAAAARRRGSPGRAPGRPRRDPAGAEAVRRDRRCRAAAPAATGPR